VSDARVLDGAALDLALHGVAGSRSATDPRVYLERFGYAPPPLDSLAEVAPLDAEVNDGRWIWRCPCALGDDTDPPLGGGVAFVTQPIGWCPRCENVGVGGGWRPLRLPPERAEIERVLSVRPSAETRNWWPGETVAELERENAEHGIEDRDVGAQP
jgi:hypothetical protein